MESWKCGFVPNDWTKAPVVPLCKSKGIKSDCKTYIGKSLLSIVGKRYGRIVTVNGHV